MADALAMEWPAGGGDMGARVRAFDWTATPLGPLAGWPQPLRLAVDLVLAMRQPASVCWGADAILIHNDEYRAILGIKHPHSLGLPLTEVWPELRHVLAPQIAATLTGEPQLWRETPFELARSAGRLETGWFTATWTPIPVAPGDIGGFLMVALETTERHRAEQAQALLLSELQHRVRNILAAVRSVVRRTAAGAVGADELRDMLEGRLNALSRTQAMLTRATGAGVDLEMLVREELLAQTADEGRITVEGPEIVLAPGSAEVVTLAIHELAANATTHGAIGQNGAIAVTWRLESRPDGPDWLRLEWVETGVRVIAPLRRRGFGTEVIEDRLPQDLGGEGRLSLRPGGVRCEIGFPLVVGESVLPPAGPEGAL
ncbi:sensor histidine kinase [Phenylobacterium sp. J367]|uniref:sensor histidine kinase n=1 Tax=Phenylobacterium sp. J367 TaxID=2898435 RepID=UPI002151E642|nr:HWE histidine kinase domain-containing protein [Phenylobacterium sp. J367]MCR5878849.1 PAS domain-containing protein [Phenylobacterium sp. J367]